MKQEDAEHIDWTFDTAVDFLWEHVVSLGARSAFMQGVNKIWLDREGTEFAPGGETDDWADEAEIHDADMIGELNSLQDLWDEADEEGDLQDDMDSQDEWEEERETSFDWTNGETQNGETRIDWTKGETQNETRLDWTKGETQNGETRVDWTKSKTQNVEVRGDFIQETESSMSLSSISPSSSIPFPLSLLVSPSPLSLLPFPLTVRKKPTDRVPLDLSAYAFLVRSGTYFAALLALSLKAEEHISQTYSNPGGDVMNVTRVTTQAHFRTFNLPQGDPALSRSHVKLMNSVAFFSSNSFTHVMDRNRSVIPAGNMKNLLEDIFPTLMSMLAAVKRSRHNLLALILQALEAHLIFDCVCTALHRAHPELFLATIHDCIVVPAQHESTVRTMMEEEVEKIFGQSPTIKRKVWE